MPHISALIGGNEYFVPLIPVGDVLFHYNISSTTEYAGRNEDIVTGVSGTDTVKWLLIWSIEVVKITSGTSLQVIKMMPADSYSALLSLTWHSDTLLWQMNNTTNAKNTIYRTRAGDDLARMRLGNTGGQIRFHYLDMWIWK